MAMKPRSETLRMVASTPLAPSSRIFASSSIGVRPARRRSGPASALRALNAVKFISTGALLARSCEGQADAAVADPADLGDDHPPLEQLQRQAPPTVGGTGGRQHPTP